MHMKEIHLCLLMFNGFSFTNSVFVWCNPCPFCHRPYPFLLYYVTHTHSAASFTPCLCDVAWSIPPQTLFFVSLWWRRVHSNVGLTYLVRYQSNVAENINSHITQVTNLMSNYYKLMNMITSFISNKIYIAWLRISSYLLHMKCTKFNLSAVHIYAVWC